MKKLLLAFGFILFVVSCGGGSPSTTSTTNYFVHNPIYGAGSGHSGGTNYSIQYYIYEAPAIPANTNDKITPDEVQKMMYAFGGECAGNTTPSPDCLTMQDEFWYGSLPSVGDPVYVSRFLLDSNYCQYQNHNWISECTTGHHLENNIASDPYGGLNTYPFLRCEWEVVSWTGVGVDIALPDDAYCDIFRYNNLGTELYWAGYIEDTTGITWFANEVMIFNDTLQSGDQIAGSFPFSYPTSPFPFAYQAPWLQQTIQPDFNPDGKPVDTWKLIPSMSNTEWPATSPGTVSPEGCQKVVSVSKEFGPLAPLTIWSYEGVGWVSPWAGVCPEIWPTSGASNEWITFDADTTLIP